MLGQPLAGFDKTPLGEGLLGALVAVARSRPGAHVVERVCPNLQLSRLPNPKAKRPSSDPVLRFTAQTVKEHAQLVVQDVTRLRWLEQTFSRYVPAKVIEQMATMPAGQFLTMERREVSVLFADLRLAEDLPGRGARRRPGHDQHLPHRNGGAHRAARWHGGQVRRRRSDGVVWRADSADRSLAAGAGLRGRDAEEPRPLAGIAAPTTG